MRKHYQQQQRGQSAYINDEGYRSPTEGAALAHIAHDERTAACMKRNRNTEYVLSWQNPKPYVEKSERTSGTKTRRDKR